MTIGILQCLFRVLQAPLSNGPCCPAHMYSGIRLLFVIIYFPLASVSMGQKWNITKQSINQWKIKWNLVDIFSIMKRILSIHCPRTHSGQNKLINFVQIKDWRKDSCRRKEVMSQNKEINVQMVCVRKSLVHPQIQSFSGLCNSWVNHLIWIITSFCLYRAKV
jgi:hypothetical protein